LFKFTFLFFVFALFFSFLAEAETEEERIKFEVMAAFKSIVDASEKLDSRLYFEHFDKKKFVGLNSDGTNWNSINDLSALITDGFEAIKIINSLEFTNVNISVIDSYTAILVNEYVQSMTLKSGNDMDLSGGGVQVWSKRSGEWKIVSVSASNKPSGAIP
jgi:hypothetical protein